MRKTREITDATRDGILSAGISEHDDLSRFRVFRSSRSDVSGLCPGKLRTLRFLLLASALAWAVSVVAVLMPWPMAVAALNGLGAGDIPADPMLDYWLRMAAGAFTGVGVFFFAMAVRPERFANVIGLAGGLMFAEGIVLLVHGLRLGLRPFPFWADTAFCLLAGGGIWALRRAGSETCRSNSARRERENDEQQ